MATGRVYKQHTFAAPDERWDAFGEFCKQLGTDRTKQLNLYMAWCNREPGVTLPRRPVTPTSEQQSDDTTT